MSKKLSLKEVLALASKQVEESPEWLKIIYKRNDMLLVRLKEQARE